MPENPKCCSKIVSILAICRSAVEVRVPVSPVSQLARQLATFCVLFLARTLCSALHLPLPHAASSMIIIAPIRSDPMPNRGVQFRSELKSYHFDSLRQWLVWWVTPSPPPSPSPSPSPSLSVAFFWDSDSDSDLDSRHLLNLFLFSFH